MINEDMLHINASFSKTAYQQITTATVLVTSAATLFGYALLKRFFIRPIELINAQLQNNTFSISNDCKTLTCRDKGEIGTLVENLNARALALRSSLDKAEEEMHKRVLNEKLLMQQSKMAAMGEMMDSVAHQWKQPLNALNLYSELIKNDFEAGVVNSDYIQNFRQDIQRQTDHMVTTLDEFRNFFRPNKEKQEFDVKEIIESVMFLTKDDCLKNHIAITFERSDTVHLKGSENELKHVFLNLFGNAKDAFNENNIQNRKIIIRIARGHDIDTIEVQDNAGGIPEKIIDTIFDANVTTKPEGKGTGIGLYLSNRIVKKHGGIFSVRNTSEGAIFVMEFKK